MPKHRMWIVPLIVAAAFTAAPAYAAEPDATATAPPAQGFVPVAIWELHREGFPTARHAWVAGSEKMLRVSYDDGITWYGFRPIFTDKARGLLALKIAVREELGRGEVAWRDAAGVTVNAGADANVTLPPTATSAAAEVTLRLVEVDEVSPSELKEETPDTSVSSAPTPGPTPLLVGGGLGSCCVSCQGMRVCDCSVCIVECHTSCCLGGCFCMTC